MARGGDKSWALSNMSIIYAYQGNTKAYAKTLAELHKVDEKAAGEIEAEQGAASPSPGNGG